MGVERGPPSSEGNLLVLSRGFRNEPRGPLTGNHGRWFIGVLPTHSLPVTPAPFEPFRTDSKHHVASRHAKHPFDNQTQGAQI